MDNFKQASRIGLRVLTSKGTLSVEQLWHLTQTELSTSIKNVKKQLKSSEDADDLAFLDVDTKVDPTLQLTFDILKDIYLTKKEEAAARTSEREKKENNQKIMALIQEKRENNLKNLSEAELLKLLQD